MENTPTNELYLTLAGDVNQALSNRIFHLFTTAAQNGIKTVHLLMQTGGGSINDGVGIYNFLKNFPVHLITYNGGCVASSGVTIFLAGKTRYASSTATFMIHKPSTGNISSIGSGLLQSVSEGMAIDETRTLAILTEAAKLPPQIIESYGQRDVHITAVDAITFGLTHGIKDFAPPFGSQIANV